LFSMQEASIKVDSNIVASEKLKNKLDRDTNKQREELLSSSNPAKSNPKLYEVTRTLKSLSSKITKLKLETKKPNRQYHDAANINKNQFRRPNTVPQVMWR
jgi:hypothetical protein